MRRRPIQTLCGILVALCLASTALAQPAARFGPIEPLVVSGRPAGGHVFSAVQNPQVDDAGNVAFIGTRASGPLPALPDIALWYRSASGELSRVAGHDDPAPGAPADVRFLNLGPNIYYHLAGDGRISLDGELYRPRPSGPLDFVGAGVWSWAPGGGLRAVAVPGADVPGMPGVTFEFGARGYTRADGAVAFMAMLSGPTVTASNSGAALFRTADGTLVTLARQGDPVPGLPDGTVFTAIPEPRTFPRGDRVAVAAPIVGNLDSLQSVVLAGTPGNLAPVASTAPQTPGRFDTIDSRTLRTGGSDRVMFSGRRDFTYEVFSGTRPDDLRGYVGDNITWASTFNSRPVNGSGQVVFTTDRFGSGSIHTGVEGGRLTIARTGDSVPGGPPGWNFGMFGGAQDLAVNDAGFVAFAASIPLGPGVGAASGLFLYHRDRGLVPVALSFDPVELANGTTGRLGGFDDLSMTDQYLVFDARLADGTTGVFRVALPEPGAAGVLLSAAALLLARRRRPPPPAVRSRV